MTVACTDSWGNPSDTGSKGGGVEGNPLQLFFIDKTVKKAEQAAELLWQSPADKSRTVSLDFLKGLVLIGFN